MLAKIQDLKEEQNIRTVENLIDDSLKMSISSKINETIKIQELKNNDHDIKDIQDFLFAQIKQTYGYGYIEKYHHDIKHLEEYYKYPERNNFYIALNEKNEIIGTIGIREYDRNYEVFKELYSKKSTASIWRLYIHKNYRRICIGTQLVKIAEKFIGEKNYTKIYLHTHKNIGGALNFWKKSKYCTNLDTEDELKTIHMIKKI